MRKAILALGAVCLLGVAVQAPPAWSQTPATDTKVEAKQDTPPQPSQTVMNMAVKKAQKEKKAVMVIFHASWCGWCKRLEAVMERPEFQKLFADNYVVVTLDVMENGEKKALENPGGGKLMSDLGGEKSGLPFYAFLDAKGKKLADSNVMPKNMNIGYPGAPEEITAFEKLLKDTAPRLSEKQRGTLIEYLRKNAPAH